MSSNEANELGLQPFGDLHGAGDTDHMSALLIIIEHVVGPHAAVVWAMIQ